MATINVPAANTNDSMDQDFFNSRFGTIADEINGNLDDQNLKNSAVTTAKIADEGVTTVKIADEAVTAPKWSNPYKFRAARTTTQSLTTTGNWNKVQLATISYDHNGNFDSTTDYKYTAAVDGYYRFSGWVAIAVLSGDLYGASILVNGTTRLLGNMTVATVGTTQYYTVSDDYYLAAGDYVELNAMNGSGSAKTLNSAALAGSLISTT